ncbi:MAG TPA: SGNH/GDSL hydrolase family protein [Pirellulales bacterium]|jgi:lysophospholipase L1-like esterase|nr:SGNH/GDSL hydrolase family protein [Pirellulales bacterium]
MKSIFLRAAFAAAVVFASVAVASAELALKPHDYVAIIGDSITEQKLYSLYMEDYLLMCQPAADLSTTQFGWGGETSWGFANRMENDMLRFHPTVATTCFGMNDGGYGPMTPEKANHYREGQTSVVEKLKKGDVRLIVVGSPGCVDSDTWRPNDPNAALMYNKTLSEERDIAREVAHAQGVLFADVITPMIETMTKAKEKYGKSYHLAGGDGVHPAQNGHLVMAYAFLKALGCNGDLGQISVDLSTGKSEASGGHKVLATNNDNGKASVEIESTRYPFCFEGDPKNPGATRGVIEFFPFNADLNRLTLKVAGVGAAGAKVTWGPETKHFTTEQLQKGINLADEFLDNPFCEPFRKVEAEIRKQQNMETTLVKQLIHNVPAYAEMIPEETASFSRIVDSGIRRDKQLAKESSAAVVPVKHTLSIEQGP